MLGPASPLPVPKFLQVSEVKIIPRVCGGSEVTEVFKQRTSLRRSEFVKGRAPCECIAAKETSL